MPYIDIQYCPDRKLAIAKERESKLRQELTTLKLKNIELRTLCRETLLFLQFVDIDGTNGISAMGIDEGRDKAEMARNELITRLENALGVKEDATKND